MAYHVRCNFNYIQSYAQALTAWQEAVIFPADRKLDNPRLPRGLVNTRKKHLTIERTAESEDIILRLYNYPVVTWHRDNSLTICAHNTRSTAVFGSHCVPEGMFVASGRFFTVTIDRRTYKVDNQITFRQRDNTWKADQITSPWSIPHVNRERAKQALDETGYTEFRTWLKVYVQMAARPDGRASWIDDATIVHMLRDRTKWRELVTSRFPDAWNYPDQVLRKIRQAIYDVHECIDRMSVPFLG